MTPHGGGGRDSATEHPPPHDGAFSYAVEYHAFMVGLILGIVNVAPVPRIREFTYAILGLGGDWKRSEALKQAKQESWYAAFGIVIGMLLGLGFYAAMLWLTARATGLA